MNQDGKQKTIETLNRRNTESVQAKLIDMDTLIREQQKQLVSMHTALSSMSERMTVLEQMVQLQKARMMGSGPSVV